MQQPTNRYTVVTGAAGFIGSVLAATLTASSSPILLVDDFGRMEKLGNLQGKIFSKKIHREQFIAWWKAHPGSIEKVYHLGARTDTTEMNYAVHEKWNVAYSKEIWQQCVAENVPLVYASSAATYGNGDLGYDDSHDVVQKLKPLNPYGVSKNEFDKWALAQPTSPPFWAGVKFFNVYGPNEYHKGRMASVIFHGYKQIKEKGSITLFKSHHPDYKDGGQIRDFIYVKDIVSICRWLMEQQPTSGLYNAGTGTGRSFSHLAAAIFKALQLAEEIEFVDTPLDIRDKYQYYTEANMDKLKEAGYHQSFYTLEEGINDYVKDYLQRERYF